MLINCSVPSNSGESFSPAALKVTFCSRSGPVPAPRTTSTPAKGRCGRTRALIAHTRAESPFARGDPAHVLDLQRGRGTVVRLVLPGLFNNRVAAGLVANLALDNVGRLQAGAIGSSCGGGEPGEIISPPPSPPGFLTGMPKIRLRTGGVGLPAASCAAI